jgi:Type IV secretion system pilin
MDRLHYLLALTQVKSPPTMPKITDPGQSSIATILQIVFSIVGALSVLMVVIGGMRYISSQGDPQQLSKAKGTILYAIVGLIVSILSVGIVTFVLGRF